MEHLAERIWWCLFGKCTVSPLCRMRKSDDLPESASWLPVFWILGLLILGISLACTLALFPLSWGSLIGFSSFSCLALPLFVFQGNPGDTSQNGKLERRKGNQRVNRFGAQEKLRKQLKPRFVLGLLLLARLFVFQPVHCLPNVFHWSINHGSVPNDICPRLGFPFGVQLWQMVIDSSPATSIDLLCRWFPCSSFAFWIYSLDYTSVANSVCLVTTSSLWTGLIALVFLRKKPSSSLFGLPAFLGLLEW